jgi:hypothetical protein
LQNPIRFKPVGRFSFADKNRITALCGYGRHAVTF